MAESHNFRLSPSYLLHRLPINPFLPPPSAYLLHRLPINPYLPPLPSFKNTLIIMTSNLGSAEIFAQVTEGGGGVIRAVK